MTWHTLFQKLAPFGDIKKSQTGWKTGNADNKLVFLFSKFIRLYILSQFTLQEMPLIMGPSTYEGHEPIPEEATKVLRGLELLCYEERLSELGLPAWRREGTEKNFESFPIPKVLDISNT